MLLKNRQLIRPRDRSHFERFTAYHESFYRHVEASSDTPFSGPALDRGLAGTLIALLRLGAPELTARVDDGVLAHDARGAPAEPGVAGESLRGADDFGRCGAYGAALVGGGGW